MVKFPMAVYRKLQDIEQFKENSPVNNRILNFLYPFYVNDIEEEQKDREYLDSCLRFQSTRLNITLMMTLDCNFQCIYCFEHSLSQSEQRFSKLDVSFFLEWIITVIKNHTMVLWHQPVVFDLKDADN